ncbi:MAG: hypothetical protein HS103_06435 [Anaerolineales bacterium]|nr:hypothetical protein [Anaerolineales bacterium]
MRRIDEALLQLISNAQENLMLISFAVYRVERLTEAIEKALQRGVVVTCFFEMDDSKVKLPSVFLTKDKYSTRMKLYTWADLHRPRSTLNKYGALHAKAAVADNNSLLISSANLTEHAMSLNIEMGLSIRGGDLPQPVSRIFMDFIEHGIFSQVI